MRLPPSLAMVFVVVLMLAAPAPALRQVDGEIQRERAEQILEEPRFGATRPTLWDRFVDWVGDRTSASPEPIDQPTGGGGAPGGQPGGETEGGTATPGPATPGQAQDSGVETPEPAPSNGADGPSTSRPPSTRGMVLLLQGLLAVSALAAVALAARWVTRRRVRVVATSRRKRDVSRDATPDPAHLFHEAEDAAARGDHASAVRLRFLGGLGRLAARGRIARTENTTNSAIAGQLRSTDFDALTRRFEQIVHGDHPATDEDDLDSQERWRIVLGEVR